MNDDAFDGLWDADEIAADLAREEAEARQLREHDAGEH